MTRIPDSELHFEYIHSSGPGGQNINKVATAVELRFDVYNSTTLTAGIKTRLIQVAGKRISKGGILVIEAKRYRLQERNRQDAIRRLEILIDKASIPSKIRRQTRPSTASREKRLDEKKRRGEIKKERSRIDE